MKVMSFNVQHCYSYLGRKIDYHIMADAIKKCGADVVGLNEVYDEGADAEFENQSKILSEMTGLSYTYFAKATDIDGDNRPYGNAIISKYPIISAKTLPVPDPEFIPEDGIGYETRCLLKVKLENDITVLSIHFGLNRNEKENAVRTILENLENEKCILMGDFNLEPDDELLNAIRQCMNDTADKFKKNLLSYPSDDPECKIDYIFVSKDIEVLSADIPDIIASDHRPHTAELIV